MSGPPAAAAIRPATRDDAAAILECLAAAFAPYRAHYTPEAFRDTVLTPETVLDRLATMTVLVAITPGGETAGTIAWQVANAEEGHLRGMAVRPAYAGSGVADELLAAAERALRARACHRISLDTTAPLERAIRFYERHGFRPSGRVTDFFGMPLYEYVKELAQPPAPGYDM